MKAEKLTTKDICYLGLGIALYVVLGSTVKIPLIGHIQSDLGYIAFGVYCMIFGVYGTVVGAVGCVLESLLFSGWFPPGWVAGQILIGICCGMAAQALKHVGNRKVRIMVLAVVAVLALFFGVGLVKTVIECRLYGIPFGVKFVKNLVAFAADVPPMLLGLLLGERMRQPVRMSRM